MGASKNPSLNISLRMVFYSVIAMTFSGVLSTPEAKALSANPHMRIEIEGEEIMLSSCIYSLDTNRLAVIKINDIDPVSPGFGGYYGTNYGGISVSVRGWLPRLDIKIKNENNQDVTQQFQIETILAEGITLPPISFAYYELLNDYLPLVYCYDPYPGAHERYIHRYVLVNIPSPNPTQEGRYTLEVNFYSEDQDDFTIIPPKYFDVTHKVLPSITKDQARAKVQSEIGAYVGEPYQVYLKGHCYWIVNVFYDSSMTQLRGSAIVDGYSGDFITEGNTSGNIIKDLLLVAITYDDFSKFGQDPLLQEVRSKWLAAVNNYESDHQNWKELSDNWSDDGFRSFMWEGLKFTADALAQLIGAGPTVTAKAIGFINTAKNALEPSSWLPLFFGDWVTKFEKADECRVHYQLSDQKAKLAAHIEDLLCMYYQDTGKSVSVTKELLQCIDILNGLEIQWLRSSIRYMRYVEKDNEGKAYQVDRSVFTNLNDAVGEIKGLGEDYNYNYYADKALERTLLSGRLTPTIIDAPSTYITPRTVAPGQTFTLYYHIQSPFPTDVYAWLGATIRNHDNPDFWYSDPSNDSVITLNPNVHVYTREFTVPTNAPSGNYDVFWGIHSGRIIGEGVMWDQLIKDNVLTVIEVPESLMQITCEVDKGVYNPFEFAELSVSMEDENLDPLDGVTVSYLVKNNDAVAFESGTCIGQGNGNYADSFIVPNSLGTSTVEVTATKAGYWDGSCSTTFTVEQPLQVGHDVGVTEVYWAQSSAISPDLADLHAMASETIRAHVNVKNFGDYREEGIPIVMRLSGPQNREAPKVYITLDQGQEDTCEDELLLDTTGLPDGFYELKVATTLPGDTDSDNDGPSWAVVLGNPGPAPGQLPYASYDWYRRYYAGASPETPVSDIGGYLILLTYQDEEYAVVETADGQVLGVLHEGDPPSSFYDGDLILYLDLVGKSVPTNLYFINFYAGGRSSFQQSEPMQTAYGFPPVPGEPAFTEIDERYCAFFDYYLPDFGGQSESIYLLGWGPRLSGEQIEQYKHQWTTVGQPEQWGGNVGRYGGSLYCTNDKGPGSQQDYYVFVPSTNMPEGDYNFLIIQETDVPQTEGLKRIGFAHSVRITVGYYRDTGVNNIATDPPQPRAGEQVRIDVTAINQGDVSAINIPISLSIYGPRGYNTVYEKTIGIIPWQGQQNISFDWDTSGLLAGTYTLTASVHQTNEADTGNNSFLTTLDLEEPPLPPLLQVSVVVDKETYNQGENILLEINVAGSGAEPIEANVYWQIIRNGQVANSGSGGSVGGALLVGDLYAPLAIGNYTLEATASKVGYLDGESSTMFTVQDSTPPTVPVLISPTEGEKVDRANPTFDWLDSVDAGEGVSGYKLQVDNNEDFTSPEIDVTVSDSLYTAVESLDDGDYYWRVEAVDNVQNHSGWSSIYLFTIDAVTAVPLFGVCHGPFRQGQSPESGVFPTEEQVKEDISIISKIASAERTYGVDDILFRIPEFCNDYGIDCYVGSWISDDDLWNQQTISDLIDIANQNYDTTKALIVGNEFLLWRPFSAESQLISLINQVNDATDIPVTTAETYETWLNHPNLANVVDFIGVHIHPYWDGVRVNDAAQHVIDKYNLLKQAYPTEEVAILETGWPTEGDVHGDAVPSEANQEKFLGDFIPLAKENNIKYFIFEAFDEPWKGSGVESHWGIYYEDRALKPRLEGILYPDAVGIISDFCGANFGPPDGYVDVWDLMQFSDHWHTRTGDSNWDSKFDLTGPNFGDPDAYVDVWDLMVFADNWHEGQKP